MAKKEHQEFASNIDLIDVLPPGLYEAVMTGKTAESFNQEGSSATGSCASNRARWTTSGPSSSPIPRTSAASPPFGGFRRPIWAYRSLLQPVIKAAVNEQSAEWPKKFRLTELPFEDLLGAQSFHVAGRQPRTAGARTAPRQRLTTCS